MGQMSKECMGQWHTRPPWQKRSVTGRHVRLNFPSDGRHGVCGVFPGLWKNHWSPKFECCPRPQLRPFTIWPKNGFPPTPAQWLPSNRILDADGSTSTEAWRSPPDNVAEVTTRRTHSDPLAGDNRRSLVFGVIPEQRHELTPSLRIRWLPLNVRDIVAVPDDTGSMTFDGDAGQTQSSR